jgi:hypothetical protein
VSELITDAVRANQVAATQRWSQGGSGASAGGAVTVPGQVPSRTRNHGVEAGSGGGGGGPQPRPGSSLRLA